MILQSKSNKWKKLHGRKAIATKPNFSPTNFTQTSGVNTTVFKCCRSKFLFQINDYGYIKYSYLDEVHQWAKDEFLDKYKALGISKEKAAQLILNMVGFAYEKVAMPKHKLMQ